MTADEPGEESGQSEVALPGPPQVTGQPMDEYGPPIQKRAASTGTRLRVATVLAGGVVTAGLAAIGVARHELSGYLQALCWLSGLTAMAVGAHMEESGKEEYKQLSAVTRTAIWVAATLALIGVFTVGIAIEHMHD